MRGYLALEGQGPRRKGRPRALANTNKPTEIKVFARHIRMDFLAFVVSNSREKSGDGRAFMVSLLKYQRWYLIRANLNEALLHAPQTKSQRRV